MDCHSVEMAVHSMEIESGLVEINYYPMELQSCSMEIEFHSVEMAVHSMELQSGLIERLSHFIQNLTSHTNPAIQY